MTEKRDPVKQIMSEVHKDARAGKINADGHDAFMAEVERRLVAAGLREPSGDHSPRAIGSYDDLVRPTRDEDPPSD
jgi:hypothetical protein